MAKIQTGIRLDESLYGKLKTIAKREGRTLNNLNEYILRRFITDYEAKHGPVAEYEE
jgi:predicted DNA-binding protein